MKINRWHVNDKSFKSILNGVIQQDTDKSMESSDKMECVTDAKATAQQLSDLEFANTGYNGPQILNHWLSYICYDKTISKRGSIEKKFH